MLTSGRVGKWALLALAAMPCVARAGEKPLYQPVPDWIVAAPIDSAASSDTSQPQQRLIDSQTRIDHGTVWAYYDNAMRVDTPEALTRVGTVTATWAPDHGDLIIHSVTILRGTQRIDVLGSGGRFQVLRREAELESLQLNGLLTATMLVEGLRVGDVLDVRMSVTQHDPVLGTHGNAAALLVAAPAPLGFGRARLLWRDDDAIRWKAYLTGVNPEITVHNGWHDLSVRLPVAKQADAAPRAPGRYAHPPLIELSDFADWAQVSAIMAPLYRIDSAAAAIRPGGDLDQEVAKIAAASPDPRRRIALALQLVQDKIRYFEVSMEGGNLTPQLPEQTWALRYGDCKAKTLLLLAILGKLAIPAEAALANLKNGDLVHDRLPSVMAFNHVMVLAHPAGATLWLDGTALGTREADLDDVPPYHWVLPVRAAGAQLLAAPARAPARPVLEMHSELDMRAGLGMIAPITITAHVQGALAGQLNAMLTTLDAETRANLLRQFLSHGGFNMILLRPVFTYDAVTGAGTVVAEGFAATAWKRADSRYGLNPGFIGTTSYPDRTRSIWQDIPVALGDPENKLIATRIVLPRHGEGIAMEGVADETLNQPGAGSNTLHAQLRDGTLDYTITFLADGGEVPASAIPAMRRQDGEFANRAPKLRTVAGYPAPWQAVEQARRDHLFDKTTLLIDRWIAEKPDDAPRYRMRSMYHALTLDFRAGIADLGKALALTRDKASLRERAQLYEVVGDRKSALADARAALDLDPSDIATISIASRLMAQTGEKDKALELVDAGLAGGDEREPFFRAIKAETLAELGDKTGALSEIDAAVEKRSGNALLLGTRCRIKGLLDTDPDGAAADCTRAIQLSDQIATTALSSRALARYRQHDWVQAGSDLDAALDINPASAEAYFLRALVRRQAGKAADAAHDIAAARLLYPAVDTTFAAYGLNW
jgi:tetratricopeptide (TPR) repeat protein/transglutaminase-like putative cysteine protease